MIAPTSVFSKTNSVCRGLAQSLLERLDKIPPAQGAEHRRLWLGTFAGAHGGVAARAIAVDECFAALDFRGALCRRH